MKKLLLLVVMQLVFVLSTNFAFAGKPDLKLPFISAEAWTVTRGYGVATHQSNTDDGYALDFVLSACNSWRRPILAAAAGRAEPHYGYNGGYGNYVDVFHGDGYVTRYAHLDSISVQDDEWVFQGQEIGRCGNTGNVEGDSCPSHPGLHLHFALYRDEDKCIPEPMDGHTGFRTGKPYTSTNGYEHSQLQYWDNLCKSHDYMQNNLVERFRNTSTGKIEVNMTPSDNKIYYYSGSLCQVSYYPAFGLFEGQGGVYPGDDGEGGINDPNDPEPTELDSDPDLHISRFHIKEEGASDYEHRVEKILAWGQTFYVKGELKVSNESVLEAKDVDSDYRLEDNRDFDKHDTKIDEDSPFDINPGEKVTKSMSAIAVKVSTDGNTLTVSRGSMSKNFPITNNFCKFYIFADVKEEGREDGDRDISSESDKDEYGVVEVTVQDPSITAELVATPTTGTNPLIVQFTDTSSGHIDQRNWNFGDGTSSSEKNPPHVYENPGSYVATLTVSNYSHVSSRQITVNVESFDPPNPGTQQPQAPSNLKIVSPSK